MVEFTKGFQCFFVRLPFKLYFMLRPATKSIKTASGAPRPKSAPRGSKSITFAQGKFQVSRTLKKWLRIQQGNPPFYHFNIRYTYGSKLQLEKFLGGCCVVSCKSIQFPNFKVQTQEFAIRYAKVHKLNEPPSPTTLSSFSLVFQVNFQKPIETLRGLDG